MSKARSNELRNRALSHGLKLSVRQLNSVVAGYRARYNGDSIRRCPYKKVGAQWWADLWRLGWHNAANDHRGV